MKRPHIVFNLTNDLIEATGGISVVNDNLHGLFPGVIESAVRSLHLDPKDYQLQDLKPTFVWHKEDTDQWEFTCMLFTKDELNKEH